MFKKLVIAVLLLGALGYGLFFWASHGTREIHISRTFNAPIERVWSNWTDEDTMKRWWSPKDYTAPLIKNDFRVGGSFLFSMKSPTGQMHYNTGTYTDIALNKKIVSKMSFADETGKAIPASAVGIPGHWPDEIELRVDFTELEGGKTRVAVTEKGIPLIMSVFAKMGWEQQFDKFEMVVK